LGEVNVNFQVMEADALHKVWLHSQHRAVAAAAAAVDLFDDNLKIRIQYILFSSVSTLIFVTSPQLTI
jgi:hypothetical protein